MTDNEDRQETAEDKALKLKKEAEVLTDELEEIYRRSVLGGIEVWGKALVEVRLKTSTLVWEAVRARLKMARHKDAEIDAGIAVGEGRLNARLFPDGIQHSKVLQLNKQDQERLLSSERFPVYEDLERGVEVGAWGHYGWLEMSVHQQNRLLAPKGGRILTLAEQDQPRRSTRIRVGTFTQASYRSGDGYMTVRNGSLEARIALTDLAGMGEQDFDVLVTDVNHIYGRE